MPTKPFLLQKRSFRFPPDTAVPRRVSFRARPEPPPYVGFLFRYYSAPNNTDIADAIASSHDIAKSEAKKLVDAVFGVIADAAAKGEEISLNGFGKFKVKDQPERQGRNPSTGAAITIAASKKLGFTPAKAVKDRLNG